MIFALCGVLAFFAGMVDSIVGGGGLILLPALLIIFPETPVAFMIATNKLVGASGTTMAVFQYARKIRIDWKVVIPAAASSFFFSILGAKAVTLVSPGLIRPLVLALLIAVAVYTFWQKDFGSLHAPKLNAIQSRWFALGVGALLGFYDGFLGPGTGSFLIFAFVGLFGFEFLIASAAAKVVNLTSNYSALIYFAAHSLVIYRLGMELACFNILGAYVGTHVAILKGSRFVRIFFLVVVSVIILKLAWDTFHG